MMSIEELRARMLEIQWQGRDPDGIIPRVFSLILELHRGYSEELSKRSVEGEKSLRGHIGIGSPGKPEEHDENCKGGRCSSCGFLLLGRLSKLSVLD